MQSPSVQYELSSGGIVYKKTQKGFEWLLIRHIKAGHWGFPKGHVADTIQNESIESAAVREVAEEGGVIAEIVDHTSIQTRYFFSSREHLHKKTVHYFLMRYISGSTADHDKEVSEAAFFTTEEAIQRITYKSDKEAFKKALQLLDIA